MTPGPAIRRGGPGAAAAAAGLNALLLASARLVPGAAPERWREPATWTFAALLVLWSALEAGLARPGREPALLTQVDRILAGLTGGALLAGAWLALRAPPSFTLGQLPLALAAAGLAAGVALRAAAVRRLGARFVTGTVAGPGPLVTDGVYRRIRHPSEAGLILAALCGALLLRSALALALAAAVVLPTAALRARREDRLLAAVHRAAHAAWRRRAGMLVPRLGRAARP